MAGSGYKLFASGEVLTAANLQGYAVDQSTMVFASSAARTTALAAPSEGMVSYLTDKNSVEIYDGSAWKRVLNTTGSILQIASTSKTDTFTTTSTTYGDVTGLSVSITPYSTSSKILILGQLSIGLSSVTSSYGFYKIMRDTTDIYIGDAASNRIRSTFGGYAQSDLQHAILSNSAVFLDSPASTSALTYKFQARKGATGGGVYVNRSAGDLDNTDTGRAASSITVMEVAA